MPCISRSFSSEPAHNSLQFPNRIALQLHCAAVKSRCSRKMGCNSKKALPASLLVFPAAHNFAARRTPAAFANQTSGGCEKLWKQCGFVPRSKLTGRANCLVDNLRDLPGEKFSSGERRESVHKTQTPSAVEPSNYFEPAFIAKALFALDWRVPFSSDSSSLNAGASTICQSAPVFHGP
jgi:hypothetical protein